MSSDTRRSAATRLRLITCTTLMALAIVAAARGGQPRFFPDDPLWEDRDTVFDASEARERERSETLDFLENALAARQAGEPGRAVNVNTVEEVPDSSWFTNRIGRHDLSPDQIARGPDLVDTLDGTRWIVTSGKGAPGFQPGFRAVDPATGQLYQLEVDLERHAELATGAEIIGTAIYHAIGYNVVDVYLVNVDRAALTISPTATIKDASGRRSLRETDLDAVFRQAARNPDGTYRMTAGRFVEGVPVGPFLHHGTRPDDPNDIYPHEHRRELRANRVFAAWLNHDDSRAPNTLDMKVGPDGAAWIRHYMFDFGSTLGSSPDRWWSGHAYMINRSSPLGALARFGFGVEPWHRANDPRRLPDAVGRFGSDAFDPARWKPEYPNRAFDNMRLDDAFWAARIVSRFSDDAIRAIVAKARYSDPAVTAYLADALIERRDRIVATWLTAINPIVDPELSADGILSFRNAAVDVSVSERPTAYRLAWSRFDNDTDAVVGTTWTLSTTEPGGRAPAELLEEDGYITVRIETRHPDYPGWEQPVRVYFRRKADGWDTVGIDRALD